MHNDQPHHEGSRLANDSSTYTPLSASSQSRVSGHHPVLLTHVRAACLQAEQLGTLDEAGGPCVIEELPFNSPELAGLPQSADVPQVRLITARLAVACTDGRQPDCIHGSVMISCLAAPC